MTVFRVASFLQDQAKRIDQAEERAKIALARRMPVIMRRDIEEEYNLTATRIRDGLKTIPFSDGVIISGSRRVIGLRNFGRQMAKGYRIQVLRANPAQLFRHAFVRVPTGQAARTGPQLFERVKTPGGGYVKRTPIKRLFGPSMADILDDEGRQKRLSDAAAEVVRTEFERQLGVL